MVMQMTIFFSGLFGKTRAGGYGIHCRDQFKQIELPDVLLLGKIQEVFQRFCDEGGACVRLRVQKCVYPRVLNSRTTECNGFKIHGVSILAYLYAGSQYS